jgi:hypothetical protein
MILGCDHRTLNRYLHRYPELKEHQVDVEETFCDKAENNIRVAIDSGNLLRAVEAALAAHGLSQSRVSIRDAIAGGPTACDLLLAQLVDKVFATMLADESDAKRPVIVLAIDRRRNCSLARARRKARHCCYWSVTSSKAIVPASSRYSRSARIPTIG